MKNNLVLGGHSFIQQLGTDPKPSLDLAAEIVSRCLDAGIVRFDTTYAPERVGLGKALKKIGRRHEAKIIAWNFFTHFDDGDEVAAHAPYKPFHLQAILDELQTDWIDLLIVHPVADAHAQATQEDLAATWLSEGRVRQVGTWAPATVVPSELYSAVVAPYNMTTSEFTTAFSAARALGWQTYATSPFVRGWELERVVSKGSLSLAEAADRMLRYAAFGPAVDYLIVSMRRVEWIESNVESWRRGPLSACRPR